MALAEADCCSAPAPDVERLEAVVVVLLEDWREKLGGAALVAATAAAAAEDELLLWPPLRLARGILLKLLRVLRVGGTGAACGCELETLLFLRRLEFDVDRRCGGAAGAAAVGGSLPFLAAALAAFKLRLLRFFDLAMP